MYWQNHACLFVNLLSFLYRFGRKFAILLSIFLQLVFGVATAFSPNIYVYMVIKFFCGTSSVVFIMIASVLGNSTVFIIDEYCYRFCLVETLCF